MFKRKLLIGALAFGTFAGFAGGFMSLGAHGARCHQARREAFEAHVADVCTRSAHRVWEERGESTAEVRRGPHGRFGGASE
ncbi:MAG: hypothetical protein M3Y87_21390 [Myxococcota bacterium]|nr:hypothetical protein [Myxococcota bacterium]